MQKADIDAEKIVRELYGLRLDFINQESVEVEDGVTYIDEDGKESYKDEKGGSYTHYDLIDPESEIIYKLVYFPDESIGNQRLIDFVKNEEPRDVKEWEEIHQSEENNNFILYKLVPITVQGKPTYS